MTLEDIDRVRLEELAKAGTEVTIPAVLLLDLIQAVEKLKEEVDAFKQNSRNSSKPPSSDKHNPNKPDKSRRKRGKKRKPGGQQGHDGYTLQKVADPDCIIRHQLPGACERCGASLRRVKVEGYETRQVFDLPEKIEMEVAEHRAEVGTCPCCAGKLKAAFPDEVKAPVQYGERIKALVIYLQTYQLLPCERLSELCADVFQCPMSPATVVNFLKKGGARAGPVAEKIKERIRRAPFMHNDETGLSLLGKTHWLHTASTPEFAYLHIDEKRGYAALKAMGILEDYKGWTIHDYLSSYYCFEGLSHGLCNAHHIRDLTYIYENLGQKWGSDMIELLLEAKKCKSREKNGGRRVGAKTIERLLGCYYEILGDGYAINPEPVRRPGQRGRLKRGKALNLLDRFRDRDEEVMAFLIHDIPFDNNEAERDLRMMKIKQKISGCFRSRGHATAFADLRSIITSARKQGINILKILGATLSNHHLANQLLVDT